MTAITPAYAHAYRLICLTRKIPGVPSQKFCLPATKVRYPHHYSVRTTTRERGNDFQVWAIYTDGSTRLADGGTFAGWGRIDVMFGPAITTDAHLAFAGARVHSNNTAEMLAMVETLFFLGPFGLVVRDAHSCVFYDSKHAAGVCLGTLHARTHVHQLLLKVQHRLRFTMQHVYGHAENLGNECADHAAALGAFGLVSNHNLSTRWARHSFDSVSCFATCRNLGDVLEKLCDIRTEHVSASQHQTRRRATRCSLLLGPRSFWLFFGHSPGSILLSLHD